MKTRPTVMARPEIVCDLERFSGTYSPETLRAAKRAVRLAGAVPPLEFVGRGSTAIVFCDKRGHAFKVALKPSDPWNRRLIAREAEWLERASQVPEIRRHVARFIAYHEGGILERECVRSSDAPGRRERSLQPLQALHHHTIKRAMGSHGYSAPEARNDSYVYARGRGWVLVDAGFAKERGQVLVKRALETLRGRRFYREWPASLAVMLEAEAGVTVPRALAERLAAQLLELPDARETPGGSAVRRDGPGSERPSATTEDPACVVSPDAWRSICTLITRARSGDRDAAPVLLDVLLETCPSLLAPAIEEAERQARRYRTAYAILVHPNICSRGATSRYPSHTLFASDIVGWPAGYVDRRAGAFRFVEVFRTFYYHKRLAKPRGEMSMVRREVPQVATRRLPSRRDPSREERVRRADEMCEMCAFAIQRPHRPGTPGWTHVATSPQGETKLR